NVYLNLRLTLNNPVVNYSPYLVVAAPTGDRSQGFSTGHVTYDWHNHLNRTFGRLTPFFNIGMANTIMDAPFYLRPFSSHGLVGHFEGGATVRTWRSTAIGFSGYGIIPSGDQTIVSKLGKKQPKPVESSLGRIFETPGESVVSAQD